MKRTDFVAWLGLGTALFPICFGAIWSGCDDHKDGPAPTSTQPTTASSPSSTGTLGAATGSSTPTVIPASGPISSPTGHPNNAMFGGAVDRFVLSAKAETAMKTVLSNPCNGKDSCELSYTNPNKAPGLVKLKVTSAKKSFPCATGKHKNEIPLYKLEIDTVDLCATAARRFSQDELDGDCGSVQDKASVDGLAMAIPGAFDPAHKSISRADEHDVTFACVNGAAAKCVQFGYYPWETFTPPNGKEVDLTDYYLACVRAVRARYDADNDLAYTCGTGDIDIVDRLGIQKFGHSSPMELESLWTSSGLKCRKHPRWESCENTSKPVLGDLCVDPYPKQANTPAPGEWDAGAGTSDAGNDDVLLGVYSHAKRPVCDGKNCDATAGIYCEPPSTDPKACCTPNHNVCP